MKPTPNPHRRPKRPIIIPDRVAARAAVRFQADESGCWISTYSTASHGYAQIGWHHDHGRSMVTAHRAAWVYHHGQQIPEGMTIDHTCKERRCVNPSHLRMLSNFENARRTSGRDWKLGECAQGHSNAFLRQSGKRWRCEKCHAEAQFRYRAKKRAEAYPGQQHLLGKRDKR